MPQRFLLFLLSLILFASCSRGKAVVTGSSTQAVVIDERYAPGDSTMLDFIKPFTTDMEQQMGEVIGYCPEYMSKDLPESSLTNWASDIMMRAGEEYLGIPMDIAVMNIGGLRCDIPQGDVTVGTIFRLMPFDNTLVIVKLKGDKVLELCEQIAAQGGQGIAGLTMKIKDNKALDIKIKGEPVDTAKTYLVSTSDFLAEGNDYLFALADGEVDNSSWPLRDIMLGIVQKDTIMQAQLDGRIQIID